MGHHPAPAWDAREGLSVATFRHGPLWNFSYLLACDETGAAAVIDPAWDVAAIIEATAERGLRIEAVLLTHAHSDHANGVSELVEATGAPVLIHAEEAGSLSVAGAERVTTFRDGEAFALGRLRCVPWHTPGHTPGSASFVVGGRLFSGDTLSVGSPGTPGPEAGAVDALWETTRRLRQLPGATLLQPGHDSGPRRSATLDDERRTNPGLAAATFEEFVVTIERSTGRRMRDA